MILLRLRTFPRTDDSRLSRLRFSMTSLTELLSFPCHVQITFVNVYFLNLDSVWFNLISFPSPIHGEQHYWHGNKLRLFDFQDEQWNDMTVLMTRSEWMEEFPPGHPIRTVMSFHCSSWKSNNDQKQRRTEWYLYFTVLVSRCVFFQFFFVFFRFFFFFYLSLSLSRFLLLKIMQPKQR